MPNGYKMTCNHAPPPMNVLINFNKFIKKHVNLQDITFEEFPKNVILIIPISRSFQYHHDIKIKHFQNIHNQ
jgi:hypothetical protein